ncbi:MAG: hypothetical protein ACI8S6_002207, partial [Myxococcota bacterium]
MILLMSALALADDLNCNGVLDGDEALVSFADPDCAAQGYSSADAYLFYGTFGCRYPIAAYDIDGDGLVGAVVSFPATDPTPDLVMTLSCDNCEGIFNPKQSDIDEDDVGDECDVCLEVFDPEQLSSDGDGLGDECDNCPDDDNLDQDDSDGDGLGDACDDCDDSIDADS